MTARLDMLMTGLPVSLRGNPGTIVRGLALDSRQAEPGFLFIALEGTSDDGHRYVDDAVRRGASAVLVSRDVPVSDPVAVVVTPDTRAILPIVAARFFSEPSKRLTLVGITGTNGKTTVSYLLEQVLAHAGRVPGVIGTVSYRFGEVVRAARNTTPDVVTFQSLLADMVAQGVDTVVAEVSSHALDQGRVTGLHFDAALFTNLSRDHLDYHGSMDAYFRAKQRLFDEVLGASAKEETLAVVNAADPHGSRLLETARARQVWGFSTRPEISAAVRVLDAQLDARGVHARIDTPVGVIQLESALLGPHSLENLVAAAAMAVGLGIAPDQVSAGLAACRRIPGRLEEIPNDRGLTVLVDYAHTPDALRRVLDGLRPVARGAVITVFGCGGDRDRGKRRAMGEAAASRSELAVLTSDNPRSEDPETILAEVLPGVLEVAEPWTPGSALVRGRHRFLTMPDRRRAIETAIRTARPGDIVFIAGKGHETVQQVGDRQLHFDDREEALAALSSAREGA